MKSIYNLVIAAFIFMLASCGPTQSQVVVAPPVTYTPSAVMGWDGNRCVMYITDDRGQQFEMDCNYYSTLMNRGGYNAVVNYYYDNPGSSYIHPYSTRFYRSNAADAIAAAALFNTRYHTVYVSHSVYHPTQTVVQRQIATQRTLYGSTYRVTNASPNLGATHVTTTTTRTTLSSPVTSQRSFTTTARTTPVRTGGFGTTTHTTTTTVAPTRPSSFTPTRTYSAPTRTYSSSSSSSPSRSSFSSSRSSFGKH